MSLGLITVLEEVAVQGPTRTLRCSIVGDDSYPTGGTVGFTALLQAATLAAGVLGSVKGAEIVDFRHVQGGGGTIVDSELHYDHTNDTLMAVVLSTAAQTANAVDLSTNTYVCLITVK
jgi:hypothetical protein